MNKRGRLDGRRPRAYQLIDVAEIAGNLSTIVDKPTHESQVRPMAGLEPEQQREAGFQQWLKKNG
jgi:hypothetical protein